MCQSPFHTRYSVLNISGVYSSHRSCKLLRGTDPLTSQRKPCASPLSNFNSGIPVEAHPGLQSKTATERCPTADVGRAASTVHNPKINATTPIISLLRRSFGSRLPSTTHHQFTADRRALKQCVTQKNLPFIESFG